MTAALQLTQQANPTAQTFVVDEASVLTGIGIYFASVSSTYPITVELRPTTEGGIPSTKRYIPGTRVTAGQEQVFPLITVLRQIQRLSIQVHQNTNLCLKSLCMFLQTH